MPKMVSAAMTSGRTDRMSVIVVYEDTLAHNRARHLCEQLLDRFWGDLDFDIGWWSFDFLRDPAMSKAATEDAARAHLVVLSLRTAAALPSVVETWFESWVEIRNPLTGAIALLMETCRPDKAIPTLSYLRQVAQRAQMDFLHEGMTERSTATEPPQATHHKRAPVTTALKKLLHPQQPASHWGINE